MSRIYGQLSRGPLKGSSGRVNNEVPYKRALGPPQRLPSMMLGQPLSWSSVILSPPLPF